VSLEGMALELRTDGSLASVEAAAQESLGEAIAQDLVNPDLLALAQALTEQDRAPALVLPIHTLMTRHAVLTTLATPEEAPETVYGVVASDRRLEKDVQEWRLSKKSGIGVSGHEYKKRHRSETLEISSSYLVAPSEEELDKLTTWKRQQLDRIQELEKSGPLGAASTLAESAYGGIDITDPERAVRELSMRALVAAIVGKQHNAYGFPGSDIIQPRLRVLFSNVTGPYSGIYREFTGKIGSAANMATVQGAIEPARVSLLSDMVGEDTTTFLEQVWDDLERLVAIERVGWGQVTRLGKLLNR
jgi:hypothetical protein